MIIVVCLDDCGGMLFNGRRQSRDRLLTKDLITLVGDGTLWMDVYSAGLFPDDAGCHIIEDDDFLEKAGAGEYAFVEDADVVSYLDKTEKIVVYRWNKRYPRDRAFPVDLNAWELSGSKEFKGYSHEMITREIYTK